MNEHGFGCLKSKYDVRDYRLVCSSGDELPERFIRKPLRVKSQGHSGTCVAHVMSEIVEFHNYKDTEQYIEYSTEFIYGFRNIDSNDDYVGRGMYLRDGLKIIQKYGDVEHDVLPYNSETFTAMKNVRDDLEHLKALAYENRITSYYKICSIEELKASLVRHGVVAASIRWYEGTLVRLSGELAYKVSDQWSGHAVLIIGYDKDGFIVQNSWGKYWGLGGTFKLKYSDYDKLIREAYGVTDDIKAVKKPIKSKRLSTLINTAVRMGISLREALKGES